VLLPDWRGAIAMATMATTAMATATTLLPVLWPVTGSFGHVAHFGTVYCVAKAFLRATAVPAGTAESAN